MDGQASRAKKAKKKAAVNAFVNGDDWEEEEMEEEVPKPLKKKPKVQEEVPKPLRKKPKVQTKAADLVRGTVVHYWDGWRGVIRDRFEDGDFWVIDEESGAVVRDEESGDIVHFKASELEFVAGPPIAPAPKPGEELGGPPGGVVIIGTEPQMMKMLQLFGVPDSNERRQPQQLLAIPCTMCEADEISSVVSQEIEDIRQLAKELRPDIEVALRTFHLQQALDEIGADLYRMDGFYIMVAITVPFPWEEIEAATGWWKKWRRDVCNQIDVGPIRGFAEPEDPTPEDTARRTLQQECGIEMSLVLWDSEVQKNIRRQLDVDLPLQFSDKNDARCSVVVLPSDASATVEDGFLKFREAPNADYLAAAGDLETGDAAEPVQRRVEPVQQMPASSNAKAPEKPQGKTVAEWIRDQEQFSHLPKVPEGWVRVKSRSGEIYFFNKLTKESTFEFPETPLPEGWTKEVSKSTGKTYYFHARRRKSQFERPTKPLD